MVLSKGGVYDVPSLVVQGNLEITGSEDIKINTKGVFIGAGVIKVASTFTGTFLLNFKITDTTEVIFRNRYDGGLDLYQGAFMIYNQFIIEKKEGNSNPQYRVKSVIDQAKVQLEGSPTLSAG